MVAGQRHGGWRLRLGVEVTAYVPAPPAVPESWLVMVTPCGTPEPESVPSVSIALCTRALTVSTSLVTEPVNNVPPKASARFSVVSVSSDLSCQI